MDLASILKGDPEDADFNIDELKDVLPPRRHSVSSAGSEYNPSSGNEHSDGNDHPAKAEQEDQRVDLSLLASAYVSSLKSPLRSPLKRSFGSPHPQERPF